MQLPCCKVWFPKRSRFSPCEPLCLLNLMLDESKGDPPLYLETQQNKCLLGGSVRFLFAKHCKVHETHLYQVPSKFPFNIWPNDIIGHKSNNTLLVVCKNQYYSWTLLFCVFSQPFVFESTVYGPCIGEDAGSVYSECGHKNVKHWTCARSYAVTLVADPCMQQRYLQYIAYMAYTYDIFIVE